MRKGTLAIALVLAFAAVGCGPAAPRPTSVVSVGHLAIMNVDGPRLVVRVSGRVVGEVACGARTDLDVEGAPGPLPWRIEFLGPGGAIFVTMDEFS